MKCWEYKNCDWIEECPAHPKFGDCCVVIQGTLCCADHELVDKVLSCKKCSFYCSEHFNKERLVNFIDELI